MGTVPIGTGELRRIHSRVVWMSGPGREVHDRVRPPPGGPGQLLDLFLDRRGDRGVADVGVDLDEKPRPMAMGSDSGWLTLAGMMARPDATSWRTTSGSICSRRATNCISSVISPRPGVGELGHRSGCGTPRLASRAGPPCWTALPAHGRSPVVPTEHGPALVLLGVAAAGDPRSAQGGQAPCRVHAGTRGVVETHRRVCLGCRAPGGRPQAHLGERHPEVTGALDVHPSASRVRPVA